MINSISRVQILIDKYKFYIEIIEILESMSSKYQDKCLRIIKILYI